MQLRTITLLLAASLIASTMTSTHALAVKPSTAGKSASMPSGFVAGLIDQHRQPVTARRLLGKPAIVHFGFTNCPVVCPTTLNEVATLMDTLGPRAEHLNFVFVTVDPERDTADVLKSYIEHFDKRIIGLTGSLDAITALAKSFKTSFAKRPYDDGYNVDHAIFAYLKDSEWRTASTLYMGDGANRDLVNKRIDALLGARLSN